MNTEKTKKKEICPICYNKITPKNHWVRYHVSYTPEIVVLACKFCNFTEFCLRNNVVRNGSGVLTPWRVRKVLEYHKKFGLEI